MSIVTKHVRCLNIMQKLLLKKKVEKRGSKYSLFFEVDSSYSHLNNIRALYLIKLSSTSFVLKDWPGKMARCSEAKNYPERLVRDAQQTSPSVQRRSSFSDGRRTNIYSI